MYLCGVRGVGGGNVGREDMTEYLYETAWRCTQWGQGSPDVGCGTGKSGYHQSIFNCLTSLKDGEISSLHNSLSEARLVWGIAIWCKRILTQQKCKNESKQFLYIFNFLQVGLFVSSWFVCFKLVLFVSSWFCLFQVGFVCFKLVLFVSRCLFQVGFVCFKLVLFLVCLFAVSIVLALLHSYIDVQVWGSAKFDSKFLGLGISVYFVHFFQLVSSCTLHKSAYTSCCCF